MAAVDKLTPEEEALLRQMETDDAANPMPSKQADAAPEPAEAVAEPAAKPADHEKLVDKRALDEERNRRKKAEQESRAEKLRYETELATVNTRLQMLAAAAEAHIKPAEPEKPIPAFDADPRANIEHNFKSVQSELAALRQEMEKVRNGTSQLTEVQRQQHALADINQWGNAQEQAFARDAPDYGEAMKHFMGIREAQLRAIGVDSPEEIRATMINDTRALAARCRQKGMDFGKTLYSLAEANGYRKSAASPSVADTSMATADSAAERLLRGQDMATTIGATGGAARGELTGNALASMNETQFAKMLSEVQKKGPGAMRAIFGS